MQDYNYKSLCAAVPICATLVNIQTYRETQRQHLIAYMNSPELKEHISL